MAIHETPILDVILVLQNPTENKFAKKKNQTVPLTYKLWNDFMPKTNFEAVYQLVAACRLTLQYCSVIVTEPI